MTATVILLFAAALAANLVVAWFAFLRPGDPEEFDRPPADVAEVWAEAEALTRDAAR